MDSVLTTGYGDCDNFQDRHLAFCASNRVDPLQLQRQP